MMESPLFFSPVMYLHRMLSLSEKGRSFLPDMIIWGSFLVLPLLIRFPEHKEVDYTALPGGFFLLTNILNIGLFYLNAGFLYPRFMNRKRWGLYLISALPAVGLLFFIKILIIKTFFPAVPLDGNTGRFAFFSTLFFLLASIVYRVVRDNIRREKELREVQSTQLMTELKFLRSQVSPHFLFNVLANLVSLARSRSDRLEPSLLMLSDLMRYMLYDSGEKKVTIAGELQYLKSYIQLQQLRFGDDLLININFDIGDNQENLRIEPMLLIPFVENAFKHGTGWALQPVLSNEPYATGHIVQPVLSIQLILKEGLLDLTVQNKFNEQDESKDPHSGIGQDNVRSRLALLYPDKHTLSLKKEKDNYIVHLTIDLT